MPPLTDENSHVLRSGSHGAALVMKTHFARPSLHGLNNKHIRNTTSVLSKLILSKIYSKNLFKQSMSHDLNCQPTLGKCKVKFR